MEQSFTDEFVQDDRKSLSQLQETILFGVARYWMLILIATGLGTALGLYLGASKPNTYMSQAKLLLRFGQREHMTMESLFGGGVARDSEPTMEDEIHMLTDREVFQRVVKEEGPEMLLSAADPKRYDDEDTPWYVRAMHSLQSYLINTGGELRALEGLSEKERLAVATKVLTQSTAVFNDGTSNVITVLHYSTSPEKAQEICKRLVEAFIGRHREQFAIVPLLSKYDKNVDQARIEFETAAGALDAHRSETGIWDLESERELAINRRDGLVEELTIARSTRDELIEEQRASAKLMEEGVFQSGEQKSVLNERITELKYQVPGKNTLVERLGESLDEIDVMLKEISRIEPERRTLTANANRARTTFDSISVKYAEIRALAEMDVEGDTNLTRLQHATLPLDKEGPKRLKLIVLGFAAGLGMGCLAAVLRQAFENHLRYPTTVQRTSGLQLLAVIPESSEVRRLQRVRQVV